jgi:hypothetical protein
MSNVITVNIFELIIYVAFNLSWIKFKNSDFGFMITYYGHVTLPKAITISASHQFTDVKSSVSSSELQLLQTEKSLNPAQRSRAHSLRGMHWDHFAGALSIEECSVHSVQKDSSSFSDKLILPTFYFSCLGFRDFSWLSINCLLHLTGLARASTSASNATFTEVSFKTAPSLVFWQRFFWKGFDFRRVTWYILLSEDDRTLLEPDVEGSLLTSKFEFEM